MALGAAVAIIPNSEAQDRILQSSRLCGFQSNPIIDSSANQSVIPFQTDHLFQSQPISDSSAEPWTYHAYAKLRIAGVAPQVDM